jgi:hypothetical protein
MPAITPRPTLPLVRDITRAPTRGTSRTLLSCRDGARVWTGGARSRQTHVVRSLASPPPRLARTCVAVCASLVLIVASLLSAQRAIACTCMRGNVDEALASAALVAELEIVEVAPPRDPDDDLGTQLLRARVVRVFATESSVSDGDEIVFVDQRCNSMAYDRTSLGRRWIAFLGQEGGRFTHGYCYFTLGVSEPLPHVLLQARRRWLARRR